MTYIPYLTPKQIVERLDKYIVGQEEAKRQVAIALRNRWRTQRAPEEIRKEIIPNNILMIGSTGVGKTEIARRLSHLTEAPFVKVEASKFTEVGYVGRDVESMVRDLVEESVRMVGQAKKKALEADAIKAVEGRLLDALIPPVGTKSTATESSHAKAEAEDDNNLPPKDGQELNRRTRLRLLERLRAKELEDKKVEIAVSLPSRGQVGVLSGGGMMEEASFAQLQEMIGSMMPKRTKKRRLSIAEARRLLMEEELDSRVDMEEVKEEALLRAQQAGIIFIDEIDKIATKGQTEGPGVSQEGVQRDLLPMIEGCSVVTKYGVVHTDRMLFIAAGAFHVARPSDLIPELQGRFPARIELEDLQEADFLRILTEPRNALVRQYTALLESEGVQLDMTPGACKQVAQMAYQLNASLENIGARRLHTVMGTLLSDPLFSIPDKFPRDKKLRITADKVKRVIGPLLEDQNLSRYLL